MSKPIFCAAGSGNGGGNPGPNQVTVAAQTVVVAGANLLVIQLALDGVGSGKTCNGPGGSVLYGGQPCTFVASRENGAAGPGFAVVEHYVLLNPPSGSNSVVVTLANSATCNAFLVGWQSWKSTAWAVPPWFDEEGSGANGSGGSLNFTGVAGKFALDDDSVAIGAVASEDLVDGNVTTSDTQAWATSNHAQADGVGLGSYSTTVPILRWPLAGTTQYTASGIQLRSASVPSVAISGPATVPPGGTAVFSVLAQSNDGTTPTYQWEKSDNGGGSYADVGGETFPVLSVSGVTIAVDSRDLYRCKVTNTIGTTVSDTAQLVVATALADVYLRAVPADTSASDVRLYDPTQADSSAGAVLIVAVASVSTAAGALTTGIPLGAVVTCSSTTTAALTTGVPLASSISALSSILSAAVTTQIKLAAAISANVVTTADMATAIKLQTAIAALSTTAGVLATAIPLTSSVTAVCVASADLTVTPAGLVGTVSANATVAGALATGIPIAGALAAVSTVAGALTTGVPLATFVTAVSTAVATLTAAPSGLGATVSANSSATGALTTGTPLASSVAAIAAVTGALATAIPFTASVAAASAAAADLLTGVRFVAATVSISQAAGTLTTGISLADYIDDIGTPPAAGSSSARSIAVGSLTTAVKLQGSALSVVTLAPAVLGSYVTVARGTPDVLAVGTEVRIVYVPAETRTSVVADEVRVLYTS